MNRALVGVAAAYGLRWAAVALRKQRIAARAAAAGDAQARASVTQRPQAKLLGLPNSAYGLAYYAALLGLAASGRLDATPWRVPARLAALAALARTLVLLAHLWRTRTWCAVCMRGHAANVALALLSLWEPRRHG